jgi:tetratricopeptide (TPR) repeat protein
MHDELKSYLLNLQALELIHEKRLFPELEYIFKHALIQEVAYDSLLLKRRKQIHEEIGKAIEEIYTERLEEFYEMLAHHYSKSENSEKAYHYLKLSGNKATRTHSLWEAFRFYREAINVLNQMPETDASKREQIEVRLLLSVPMRLLGYPEDSLQILEEGERHSKDIGDEKSLLILHSNLGSYHSYKGDPLLGQKYTEKCFQEAEKIQDIELMAPIACDLCTSYIFLGKFLQMVDVGSKVLPLLEKTQRQRDFFGSRYNVYSGLCAHCAHASAMIGDFEEGRVLCDKGLHFALEINAKYCSGWVELCYASLFAIMGDGRNAIEHSKKSIGYLEEAQAIFLVGDAWAYLGFGFYLMGELGAAQENIEKGLKSHRDAKVAFHRSLYLCLLGIVHLKAGDLEMARSCTEEALRLSQETNEKWVEAWSRIWLGRIIGKGETSRAGKPEEYIFQGMEICDELKLKPFSAQGYLFLGELHINWGHEEKALENLKKAEVMFQEMGMDYWTQKTREVLRRL